MGNSHSACHTCYYAFAFDNRHQSIDPATKNAGSFCFFYILLHFSTWLVIDNFFDIQRMFEDIVERYYILFGSAAFLMLIPLAATSTNRMVKWLGAKRWLKLHKLVYLIGILGVVHFYLQVKADITQPVIYGAILAFLLGFRVYKKYRKQPSKR